MKLKVIVILDDNLGMLFNNRRQSRDRVLIDDIIKTVKDNKIYIEEYICRHSNKQTLC